MGYDGVKLRKTSTHLMQLLEKMEHELVAMRATAQELISAGGPGHSGGVGPHIEDLVKQDHDFGLLAGQIQAQVLQVKAASGE